MISKIRILALGAAMAFAAPVFAQAPAPATPAPAKPAGAMSAPAKPAAATPAPAKPAATSPSAKEALLDINSASIDELAALKGIGAVRSKAIVDGRPYKGKDELVQKNIIPQAVYDKIKNKIIAKQK